MTEKAKWIAIGGAVALSAGAALLSRSAAGGQRRPVEVGTVNRATVPIPRLVDLGAGKCIPCKAMAPVLEQLRVDYAGKLQVEVIDVWVDHAAGERYGVKMIPTQIFYAADGRELWRHEGFMSRQDILASWMKLGVSLD